MMDACCRPCLRSKGRRSLGASSMAAHSAGRSARAGGAVPPHAAAYAASTCERAAAASGGALGVARGSCRQRRLLHTQHWCASCRSELLPAKGADTLVFSAPHCSAARPCLRPHPLYERREGLAPQRPGQLRPLRRPAALEGPQRWHQPRGTAGAGAGAACPRVRLTHIHSRG